MLEADTTLATLAPIIKSGGVVPERYVFVRGVFCPNKGGVLRRDDIPRHRKTDAAQNRAHGAIYMFLEAVFLPLLPGAVKSVAQQPNLQHE